MEKPAVVSSIDCEKVTHGKPGVATWLVRRGIAAGKTQLGLGTQQAAILRSV